jgi:NHL repeat
MKAITPARFTVLAAVFFFGLEPWVSLPDRAQAQSQWSGEAPRYEVDPFWPKPLPDRWVTGEIGGVCVDAQDHVFTVNRGDLTPAEQITATAAPPITEFDPDGKLVNAWGDRNLLPKRLHGCFVDYQNNIWIGGSEDGIYQMYTHDGSKMLLQIGTKGKFDTSDGTISGAPMNSSHTLLNLPASVAVDPANGDVYIADGYGNRRVVVFDSTGHFLRQWGRQGTVEEVDSGVGGVFLKVVHCVVLGNDGLVYVCDRLGGRIEVFDKMGNFKRSILVESKNARATGVGSACWMGFSPDQAQKFIIVGTCVSGEIKVLDHATGQVLSTSGRPGNQVGGFGSVHSLAVNSKGDVIVGDAANGRRIQMWRLVR